MANRFFSSILIGDMAFSNPVTLYSTGTYVSLTPKGRRLGDVLQQWE